MITPLGSGEATSGICYRTLQYAESQVNKLEITSEKQYIAAAGNSQVGSHYCWTDPSKRTSSNLLLLPCRLNQAFHYGV